MWDNLWATSYNRSAQEMSRVLMQRAAPDGHYAKLTSRFRLHNNFERSKTQNIANCDGNEILPHFNRSRPLSHRNCTLTVEIIFDLAAQVSIAANHLHLYIVQT